MPLPNENAPLTVIPGALRFNTDTMELEYYRGGPVGFGTTTQTGEWVNISTDSPDIQTGGARGVFGGGMTPSYVYLNTIDYITISTTGNALDFGDLTQSRGLCASCSSSTRGVFAGGYVPPNSNVIDYITISSTGNALDFGDLTQSRHGVGGCSSSTRGIFASGFTSPTTVNTIDYSTIASTGNAVDFGDISLSRYQISTCSSSTRAIFAGGNTGPSIYNTIDYVTISSTGNASDFGDLTQVRNGISGCSSAIRGLFGGGMNADSPTIVNNNIIDFVTIATIGNASDFGDLTQARRGIASCSSPTRGVFGGGYSPAILNTVDYITILTTGNAQDFGDLSQSRAYSSACSNGHGGLG